MKKCFHYGLTGAIRPVGIIFLLVLGLMSRSVSAQFAPVLLYSTGVNTNPSGVVLGDVNGDGRVDIVAANASTSTVGVLFGQANGFAPVVAYALAAGSYPTGVAVGDVNGDRRLDLVTANQNGNSVSVLQGQVGGFAPVVSYSTGPGSAPRFVVLGDVSGDGRLDIVSANLSSFAVGVFLGQVSGFAPMVPYATGANSYPQGVGLGDVNSDGQVDIVSANLGTDEVGVLLGLGRGSFRAGISYALGAASGPNAVLLGDVNADGRLDVVTANDGTSTVGIGIQQTGGGFAPVSNYSTGVSSRPLAVALGDVNNDGRPDIVTANYYTNAAGVLLGLAGGGFGLISTYSAGVGSQPRGMILGDVNNDGRLDIVLANTSSSTIGVLLNTTPLATPSTKVADSGLILLPNPAHHMTMAQLPSSHTIAATLTIMDALGRVAHTQPLHPATAASLDLTGLAPGLYQVRVQANGQQWSQRLVVE